MRQQRKTRQAGISFITLLIVIAFLAGLGLLGAQAFPTFLEYQAVLKAVNKASAGNTVPEVKAIFERAAQIDNITSIAGKDLVVTKNNDKVIVSFAYDKEIHIFGPAYLLLKYAGQSK
jgi:hypothetical protein